jgi:hypothetical protein
MYIVFFNKHVQIGLLVLGFREMKALKAYHQVSHPYFIYPDESASLPIYHDYDLFLILFFVYISNTSKVKVYSFYY